MARKEEKAWNSKLGKKAVEDTRDTEELLFDISCMEHVQENGWIYYINIEDNNVIWRIRENGEDNQSMQTEEADCIDSVEEGKWLHYTDINGESRRVTVRGKYDQEL